MPIYYMLLDAAQFHHQLCPTLAASWRQHSFEPCRTLCRSLLPAAQSFAERYHTGPAEALLCKVARDLPFDRHFWTLLVGEILLFAATEIPEIQVAPDTLCCLLAPENYLEEAAPRERFAPIQQAHFGSRELNFGGKPYRPEYTGFNDVKDVSRLCNYLTELRPEQWSVGGLSALRDAADESERQEELEIVGEWFPALCELYQRAASGGQVIICEIL
jgi:hypothetical protein